MFDDEKIQLIEAMPEADAVLIIWIKLLIQAGKANANGYIMLSESIPYTPEMLGTIFRRPLPIIKFALKILSDLEMIDVTDSHAILINNWEKHQNIEGLEKVREQNRIRKHNERERKRLLLTENADSSRDTSQDVTQQIKNKIKSKKKNTDIPVPPLNEFLEYAKTIQIYHPSFDFQITAKYNAWDEAGWRDGNNKKILNWKTKLQNTMPYFKKDITTKTPDHLKL